MIYMIYPVCLFNMLSLCGCSWFNTDTKITLNGAKKTKQKKTHIHTSSAQWLLCK